MIINVKRQRTLILTAKDIRIAQELFQIDTFWSIPVDMFVQLETITLHFLLRLNSAIMCYDIASELME